MSKKIATQGNKITAKFDESSAKRKIQNVPLNRLGCVFTNEIIFFKQFDKLFLLTDKLHQETYLQTFEESKKSVTSFMNGP